jgi:hypothetical protein
LKSSFFVHYLISTSVAADVVSRFPPAAKRRGLQRRWNSITSSGLWCSTVELLSYQGTSWVARQCLHSREVFPRTCHLKRMLSVRLLGLLHEWSSRLGNTAPAAGAGTVIR